MIRKFGTFSVGLLECIAQVCQALLIALSLLSRSWMTRGRGYWVYARIYCMALATLDHFSDLACSLSRAFFLKLAPVFLVTRLLSLDYCNEDVRI